MSTAPGRISISQEDIKTEASDMLNPIAFEHLEAEATEWRRLERDIVLSTGCFDLLHPGHIQLLQYAKSRRSRCVHVVGINSDAVIKRLKGEDRPLYNEQERILMLGALDCVDAIVVFPQETPAELIQQLRPDLFIKGGDWKEKLLPEYPLLCGYKTAVEFAPYDPSYSTTRLIERIRRCKA